MTSPVPDIVWPDPPDKPRIKYVGMLKSSDDVGGASFLELMVGKDPRAGVYQPMGLAASEDGQRVYVADFAWNLLFVFDRGTGKVRFIGDQDRFPLDRPLDVALDQDENVYVTDTGSRSVRVYDKNGKFLRGIGKGDLVKPTGVAINRQNRRLYVVDTGHNEPRAHQVKIFDLEGKLIKEIGRRGDGDGEFNFPTFATLDPQGRLYVVDSGNFRIQVFDPDGRFLRKFGRAGDKIGDFSRPKGVALDSFGNIYVVDSRWSNVQIFNQKGELLLILGGVGTQPGLLLNPATIAIDKENKIYVSDSFGKRVNTYQLINTTAEESFEAAKAEATGGETKRVEKGFEAPKPKTKGGETK